MNCSDLPAVNTEVFWATHSDYPTPQRAVHLHTDRRCMIMIFGTRQALGSRGRTVRTYQDRRDLLQSLGYDTSDLVSWRNGSEEYTIVEQPADAQPLTMIDDRRDPALAPPFALTPEDLQPGDWFTWGTRAVWVRLQERDGGHFRCDRTVGGILHNHRAQRSWLDNNFTADPADYSEELRQLLAETTQTQAQTRTFGGLPEIPNLSVIRITNPENTNSARLWPVGSLCYAWLSPTGWAYMVVPSGDPRSNGMWSRWTGRDIDSGVIPTEGGPYLGWLIDNHAYEVVGADQQDTQQDTPVSEPEDAAAVRAAWRADIEKISRILISEAEARSWCSEYDTIVRRINAEVSVPLLQRHQPTVIRYRPAPTPPPVEVVTTPASRVPMTEAEARQWLAVNRPGATFEGLGPEEFDLSF